MIDRYILLPVRVFTKICILELCGLGLKTAVGI